ncbi:MAG: Ada metal-binding domain-containing protein, partial [Pyrinomonadaceae bacterium]
EKLFDVNLDNFSALVVYLSLISLAELPDLWKEHHDENLIFTKADFLAPEASALFAKVKEIGAEHRRLAEILETAAKSDPSKVPSLLELVTAKSKLPAWMVAPIGADVIGKTREVAPVKNAAAATPAWTVWEQHRDRAMPQSPGSHTVQSVFSGTPPAQNSSATITPPTNPLEVRKNAIVYAKALPQIRRWMWFWFVLFFNMANVVGLPFGYTLLILIMALVVIPLLYGFNRALKERDAFLRNVSLTGSNALSSSSPPAKPLPWWMMKANNAASAQNASQPMLVSVTADAIIANRALGIYHSPDCDWADTISPKNRVGFSTSLAAQTAGYHACKVCAP